MGESGRTVLFEKEMADPGEGVADGEAGSEPPEVQRGQRVQRRYEAERCADEVQPAAGAVRMLRQVKRIEVPKPARVFPTLRRVLSHAGILASRRTHADRATFGVENNFTIAGGKRASRDHHAAAAVAGFEAQREAARQILDGLLAQPRSLCVRFDSHISTLQGQCPFLSLNRDMRFPEFATK